MVANSVRLSLTCSSRWGERGYGEKTLNKG